METSILFRDGWSTDPGHNKPNTCSLPVDLKEVINLLQRLEALPNAVVVSTQVHLFYCDPYLGMKIH